MTPIPISLIVLGCALGGALLGIVLRATLPEREFTSDSKDLIKLGIGLIGTMAALILGLLLASTRSAYDTTRTELTELEVNVELLDRALAHYGTETKEARDLLRQAVGHAIEQMWSKKTTARTQLNPALTARSRSHDLDRAQ